MDDTTVAVASHLTPVRRLLEERGYRVIPLESAFGSGVSPSAYVVAGVDDNIMGIATRQGRAPVIDAAGRSAEAVAADVERIRRSARSPSGPS
ncbi:MAG TPA: YkuS family protein [Bacillota bacterium]